MRAQLIIVLFAIACASVGATRARAETAASKPCTAPWPGPFAANQPFNLDDPRSGLALRLEADGRHMSATTRQGKMVWKRDLFSDPNLIRMFPPPFQIQGEPPVPIEVQERQTQDYIGHLGIDRLAVGPDCMVTVIDHDFPAQLKGHYILAGSGTHYFWLIDAKTGDLWMEESN